MLFTEDQIRNRARLTVTEMKKRLREAGVPFHQSDTKNLLAAKLADNMAGVRLLDGNRYDTESPETKSRLANARRIEQIILGESPVAKRAAPKPVSAPPSISARSASYVSEDNGNENKIKDDTQAGEIARKWAMKFIAAEKTLTEASFSKVFEAMKHANLPKEIWDRCAVYYRRYPTFGWTESRRPPVFSRKSDSADYIHDTFFRGELKKLADAYTAAEASKKTKADADAATAKKAAAKAKRDAKKAAVTTEDKPAKKKASASSKKASAKKTAKKSAKKAAKKPVKAKAKAKPAPTKKAAAKKATKKTAKKAVKKAKKK